VKTTYGVYRDGTTWAVVDPAMPARLEFDYWVKDKLFTAEQLEAAWLAWEECTSYSILPFAPRKL
jgi:hypothetical protein